MSDDEKNGLIGSAASAYQSAKIEVAYIEARLNQVRIAYALTANSIGTNSGRMHEIQVIGGTLKFGINAQSHPEDLLDSSGLMALILELEKAREDLMGARAKLQALGMTTLT